MNKELGEKTAVSQKQEFLYSRNPAVNTSLDRVS